MPSTRFEGAMIANNIVDTAAMGVSVTNFNEGGRLAVVQGNVIRNLFLRKDAARPAASASASRPTASSAATSSKARPPTAFSSAGATICAM